MVPSYHPWGPKFGHMCWGFTNHEKGLTEWGVSTVHGRGKGKKICPWMILASVTSCHPHPFLALFAFPSEQF